MAASIVARADAPWRPLSSQREAAGRHERRYFLAELRSECRPAAEREKRRTCALQVERPHFFCVSAFEASYCLAASGQDCAQFEDRRVASSNA